MTGPGGRDLATLLASLRPECDDVEYVFTIVDAAPAAAVVTVSEREGLTAVVPRAVADEHRLSYDGSFARLTLTVHSALDAVGLTAAVASALAERGISANVVAGFHHDHVFVPHARRAEALAVLAALAALRG